MIPWLNGCSATWFNWMAAMIFQSAVLIAIIWAVDLLLRRFAWPQFRYMLWLLVFIKLLLPPGFALPTSISSSGIAAVQHFIHSDIAKPYSFSGNGQPVQKQIETGKANISQSHTTAPSFSWQTKLMLIWLAGVLLLAFWLCLRLRHLRMVRSQSRLPEWFAPVLQECADTLSLKRVPAVAVTSALKCPAVFGIFRPAILLPSESIGFLDRKQASNILIHELMHIKRNDPLVHAVQIALQILFWPNLLLWLIRRPMYDLRELCCDASAAAVLRENTPSYRQTLVDMACRLISEPANPGMGFLGLFERPHSIVTRLKYLEKPRARQTLCKYASVFASLAMLIFVLPMSPMRAAPGNQEELLPETANPEASTEDKEKPRFEVISIKRMPYDDHYSECDFHPGGRFKAYAPLRNLIYEAYEIGYFRIEGIPSSFVKPFWDIEAKPEEGKYPLKNGLLDPHLGRLMLQSMLEDRFKLKVHREMRIMQGYELVIAKGGHKLTSAENQKEGPRGMSMPGHLRLFSTSMADFASSLTLIFYGDGEKNPKPVVDKTGLEGSYKIELSWTPDSDGASIAASGPGTFDDPEITIFDAIEDQLGLKLVPVKVPTPVIVVDSVQMPTSN